MGNCFGRWKILMKYDFPVELKDIWTLNANDIETNIAGKKAVVRQDTNAILGIVSDSYQLLKHEVVVNSFRKALKKIPHEEKIEVVKDGAILFAKYRLPEMLFEVRKDDFVALEFIVKNSYDGSNSLQIILGAFRLVCTNGMIIGKKFFTFSQRHIGKGGEIEVETIKEKIEFLTGQFEKTINLLKQMSNHELRTGTEGLFDKKLVKLPEYLLVEAEKRYVEDNDFTQWGYYNALTNAITHSMRKYSQSAMVEYGKRAWSYSQTVQ